MSLVGLGIHKHRVHAGGKISRAKKAASTEIKHITHEEKATKKQIEKIGKKQKTAVKKAEKSENSLIKKKKTPCSCINTYIII